MQFDEILAQGQAQAGAALPLLIVLATGIVGLLKWFCAGKLMFDPRTEDRTDSVAEGGDEAVAAGPAPSIAIVIGLERAVRGDADILGLLGA